MLIKWMTLRLLNKLFAREEKGLIKSLIDIVEYSW